VQKIGKSGQYYCSMILHLHQCFEQLLDLDLDLEQMRRGVGVGKKRRGYDERNLAHQGSQATFFLGRMRATSAGSCDAGASPRS
jgi:hypothetical protein